LIICLFALLFYVARPFNPDNNRYLAWTISKVGRALLGMKCTVAGAENMPVDRPTVVIANHQHNDDLFMLGMLLPPRTVTVGKSALVWVPFFGQVFWLGGNVILDRGRSHRLTLPRFVDKWPAALEVLEAGHENGQSLRATQWSKL
jgi:1-acyl-sn-glycerol-3-phosphate acyltransferase